jgi:hypothetical protein
MGTLINEATGLDSFWAMLAACASASDPSIGSVGSSTVVSTVTTSSETTSSRSCVKAAGAMVTSKQKVRRRLFGMHMSKS